MVPWISGLLLLSVPDFGNPESLAMAVAVEKPIDGVLRLATSVDVGEPEETADEHQQTHKSKPNMPVADII